MRLSPIYRALFLMALLVLPQLAPAAPLLTVETHRWTNAVDQKTRQFDLILSNPVQAKNIVLWMQLNGSLELLERRKTRRDFNFL